MGNNHRILEKWEAEEREELLRHISILPCPIRVAESLDVESLLALVNAQRDRLGGYKLPQSQRGTRAWKELVAAGIVEGGWGGVGSFGMKVRKVAIAMKNRGDFG